MSDWRSREALSKVRITHKTHFKKCGMFPYSNLEGLKKKKSKKVDTFKLDFVF